jgi:hypothetical protein
MGDRVDAREMFWVELRWDSDRSAIGKAMGLELEW